MFEQWWSHARSAYMDLGRDAPPQLVTLYYDPLLDVHHKLPVMVAVINALYLAPQRREEAQRLFDAGLAMVGALDEGPPMVIGERMTAVSLLLAREWGLEATASRLAAGAEAKYEPTWDRARGEFTWRFGLGEEHPRGQYNAIMAAAEATTARAWTALTTEPPPAVTGEVVGVDFPVVALRQAAWIGDRLHLATEPMSDAVVGSPTSWRVTGLDDPGRWAIDGADDVSVESVVDGRDLVIRTTIGFHHYVVRERSAGSAGGRATLER